MAGSFYRAPAPGEPSFCKEGDKVTKGQTVCIIEAMKLMNEIEVRTLRNVFSGAVKVAVCKCVKLCTFGFHPINGLGFGRGGKGRGVVADSQSIAGTGSKGESPV